MGSQTLPLNSHSLLPHRTAEQGAEGRRIFPGRCVSKPRHLLQRGWGTFILFICKVARKKGEAGRAGELSQGGPRQDAGFGRRRGCGSSFRACGVQVAKAALGGRPREEGGNPRWSRGGVREPLVRSGFCRQPPGSVRSSCPGGRAARRQRRRSLSWDVEAAARAGVRAEPEEESLAPDSPAPSPSLCLAMRAAC